MSHSGNSRGSHLDDTETLWKVLTVCVEQFIAAWQQGPEPPSISQFAPVEPATTRRMALIELVKVDLEYRWQDGSEPRRVEQYLEEFPELSSEHGVPCDLLYEEFHIRRRCGDRVEPRDYFERFPQQEPSLRRLLELETPLLTTALHSQARPADFQLGDRLDDFDLYLRLGQGAFATVYLARQRSLERMVALKVSAHRGNEPQTLAQLDHPHIVRVHDQRVLTDPPLRLLYMQYVPGGTMQDVIESLYAVPAEQRSGRTLLEAIDLALELRGQPSAEDSAARENLAGAPWWEVVCRLGMKLADALDYAHHKGVLHRDIKPANILISSEGSPKLVDFNISFCSKVQGSTPAAYFGGSLAYMSPEQLQAYNPSHERLPESLDARSDVYSLGVALWELLTGSRPFADEPMQTGWAETLDRLTRLRQEGVDPALLDRLCPDCPHAVRQVLLKCLAPDPQDRHESAGQLAQQLRLCQIAQAQELLRPTGRSWVLAVRRVPLAALALLLLAILLPNGVAALFNLTYNYLEIIKHLKGSEDIFWNVQAAINSVAFPLGIAFLIALSWPVISALRRVRDGQTLPRQLLQARRGRCLRLGHYAAVIGTAEWLIAGIAYPLALYISGVQLSAVVFLHWIISLALCGVIAATYPFFAISALSVRALYPALLDSDCTDPAEVARLGRLHRLCWFYLVLAASLPMLGVALLVILGEQPSRLALGVLSAGGLLGFGLLFWLSRVLQNDLNVLASVVRSAEQSPGSGQKTFT